MRTVISFCDSWTFKKPGAAPETVILPHTWNAQDGQDGGSDYFRGTCVYEKTFSAPELKDGERCFIEFEGAAMTAEVTLNGALLVRHDCGFSAFRADMTDLLRPVNTLTVAVDNSANDRVYPQKADFTFYGGIYRPVRLIVVPAEHFELEQHGMPGIKVTPVVDLEKRTARVTVETWHNAGSVAVTVQSPLEQGALRASLRQPVREAHGR